MKNLASRYALDLACGHCFIIVMKKAYPINVLNKIKQVPEVCSVYAATANPLQVLTAEIDQGRGVIGVIDGMRSKGIETEEDAQARKDFLRKIGYKL